MSFVNARVFVSAVDLGRFIDDLRQQQQSTGNAAFRVSVPSDGSDVTGSVLLSEGGTNAGGLVALSQSVRPDSKESVPSGESNQLMDAWKRQR